RREAAGRNRRGGPGNRPDGPGTPAEAGADPAPAENRERQRRHEEQLGDRVTGDEHDGPERAQLPEPLLEPSHLREIQRPAEAELPHHDPGGQHDDARAQPPPPPAPGRRPRGHRRAHVVLGAVRCARRARSMRRTLESCAGCRRTRGRSRFGVRHRALGEQSPKAPSSAYAPLPASATGAPRGADAKIVAVSARARHCMKCGGALRAAREDGRTRRRCARCGWTFYDNPVPAVGAVVTGRAGVLLARRARPPYEGTWDIPGGFLEAGEDPERGLQRELREELGTRAAATRLLGFCHDHYGPGGFPILTVLFAVRLSGS